MNTIRTLKLDKINSSYRTEYVRYYVFNTLKDEDYMNDYKYISDNDVCLVILNYNGHRKVCIGHKCIDHEDNEYVLDNCNARLEDIKAIYSELGNQGLLNKLYFL